MNPPHHRASQPPTSHVVPGAPGVPGHPPYPNFVEPPPLIPGIFLHETIGAIRGEAAGQARLINDQYSSVARGYTEMNARFELHVRQTDKILAEQHAQLEQILDGVRNDTRRFCERQTAAITDLGNRLSALEAITEASREAMASKIEAVAEAVGHGFNHLAGMMKKDEYDTQDQLPFEDGPLADYPPLEAFPNLLTLHEDPSAGDAGCESQHDADEVEEALAPAIHSQTDFEEDASEPQEEQRVESPTTVIFPSTPTGYETDQAPSTPGAEDLFGATSPLTPVSSLQDCWEHRTSISSPDVTVSTPHPAPSDTRRKRKRTLSKPAAAKHSRQKRESQLQGDWEDVSGPETHTEGSPDDQSIWPPVIEDAAKNNMYIQCDACAACFHHVCVGFERDDEDESPWTCPFCVQDPMREATPLIHEDKKCSRPGCIISTEGEYYMDRLMGRCYVASEGIIKYLVSYEYFGLDSCTWEPPENFSNDITKIDNLWKSWAGENPGVDPHSLDPRETVLLREVYVLASDPKKKPKWPGA